MSRYKVHLFQEQTVERDSSVAGQYIWDCPGASKDTSGQLAAMLVHYHYILLHPTTIRNTTSYYILLLLETLHLTTSYYY